MRLILLIAMACLLLRGAAAQTCPNLKDQVAETSAAQPLTGVVVYHDEIRQWLALELDQPVCGERIVQLLPKSDNQELYRANMQRIESVRGSRVTVHGVLGLPFTGYYSAELYQIVDEIVPVGDCLLRPSLPDYSHMVPRASVGSYRVTMRLDYAARGGHIHVIVRSDGRALQPWQAYAGYWLTGGYVFYAECPSDFSLSRMRGTSAAKPRVIDNQIAMDPESAAEKGVTKLELSFTCRR